MTSGGGQFHRIFLCSRSVLILARTAIGNHAKQALPSVGLAGGVVRPSPQTSQFQIDRLPSERTTTPTLTPIPASTTATRRSASLLDSSLPTNPLTLSPTIPTEQISTRNPISTNISTLLACTMPEMASLDNTLEEMILRFVESHQFSVERKLIQFSSNRPERLEEYTTLFE